MAKTAKFDRTYFKGKNALITGGAGGIGLALIEELFKSEVGKIVLADINQDRLDEEEKRLGELYGTDRVKALRCDVTQEDEVQAMIAAAAEFFDGPFDLLFNNAGATFFDWFEDVTDEMWEQAFKLNFYSAVYGCRAVIPIMIEQGGGQIINTISGVAFIPMAYWSRYSTTKAALNAVTMVMRSEYWDDNIKISSATPGTTATNIFADAGHEMPKDAQSPQQAACRMLAGVVKNERIIFGDDADVSAAKNINNHARSKTYDKYLLRVARERKAGETAL